MLNALYRISNGRLLSLTSLAIDSPPQGTAVKSFTADYDGREWDTQTLTFKERITRRDLRKIDFLRLFTRAERISMRQVAKTNENIEDFLDLLAAKESINMLRSDTKDAINYMASVGVLTAARRKEILDG